jgi:hypothetical protein
MAHASHALSSPLSAPRRRRQLRRLSDELARLETAARAARTQRRRLEQARGIAPGPEGEVVTAPDTATPTASSRNDQLLAAAQRREEALRTAIGDCRSEIFRELVHGAAQKSSDGRE